MSNKYVPDEKVNSDDDDDDDDYCPIKNVDEQSEPSDESEHDDNDIVNNDQDEQIKNKKQNDLYIAPYDESKTNELWRNFTSNTKPSSTTTIDSPKPTITTTTISKTFEYAGEKVSVPITTTNSSLKRPAPSSTTTTTSNSLLDRLGIGKKPKLSTLEKSRLDWNSHKQSELLTDDLDSHRRGKDSYVEKKAFLQRSELREHDHYLTNVKKK